MDPSSDWATGGCTVGPLEAELVWLFRGVDRLSDSAVGAAVRVAGVCKEDAGDALVEAVWNVDVGDA